MYTYILIDIVIETIKQTLTHLEREHYPPALSMACLFHLHCIVIIIIILANNYQVSIMKEHGNPFKTSLSGLKKLK